jgi:hypothetical protein
VRSTSAVVLVALAACTTPDPVPDNVAPVASITAPTAGVSFAEGASIAFSGTVTDPDGAVGDLSVRWVVGDEPLCPPSAPSAEGLTTCEAVLPVGSSVVTLVVTDPQGASGEDTIDVVVNPTGAPEVTILAPDGTQPRYYADVPLELRGVVADAEDPASALAVAWTSDRDGAVGGAVAPDADGVVIASATLTEGAHALTLRATDTDGKVGEAVVRVNVGPANTPPSCGFLEPADAGVSQEGEPVALRAAVGDVDEGPPGLDVVLTSDRDGVLGTIAPTEEGAVALTTSALSLGTHRIGLVVTDEVGATCEAEVLWTVGVPPAITLEALTDGLVVDEGRPVALRAVVADERHAPSTLSVTFRSDVDGELLVVTPTVDGVASGEAARLAIGPHRIVARVTNPDGLYAEAPASIRINAVPTAPGVSLSPESPLTTDDLVVSIDATSTDADGETLTYRYVWSVDGSASEASTSATLPGSATRKGERWSVSVIPSDGFTEGPAGVAEVVVANAAPTVGAVTVSPSAASATTDLTCEATGVADADGDAVELRYAWEADGAALSATTATLPASELRKGQSITCTVTPFDGDTEGEPVTSAAVEVANTAPTLSGATIDPAVATVADTLTCAGVGFADADGDEDASTISWTIDGAEVGSGATLEGAFARDEVVVCTITPFDGEDAGEAVSASITIGNALPSIDAVALSPEGATAADALTCAYEGFADADGDADASEIRWTVDGADAGTGPTLSAGAAPRGAEVVCTVTPFDGLDAGEPLSASLTVENAAPSVEAVTITPTGPRIDDTLTCAWTGFDDADGDADASTVRWTVDGEEVGTGATLAGAFAKGQVVVCEVTPFDGELSGDAVTAEVTVLNTAPELDDVALSPDPATTDAEIVATPTSRDADGDALTHRYTWFVNGEDVGVDAERLDGATWFSRDDEVEVAVVADDGDEESGTVRRSLVVANSAPTLGGVSITPESPSIDDEVTCAGVGFEDADGDPDETTYVWRVGSLDGEVIGEGATLGMGVERGVTVFCIATPFDGLTEGEPVSASVRGKNTAPEVRAVTLSPTDPTTTATLVATVDAYDADGDALALAYAWTVDGEAVDADGDTLDGGFFAKGQRVAVTVMADDGLVESAPLTSDEVEILNTPPTVGAAILSPSALRVGTTATCAYTGFEDADGDADASTLAWRIGDTVVSTEATIVVGDVAKRGETLVCEVTPFDGEDAGAAVSVSRTVENRAPVVAAVTLSPDAPRTTDAITATATATDGDGDGLTLSYTWTVNGAKVDASGAVLGADLTKRGDVVRVSVVADDGAASSAAVASSEITVLNTAPTARGAFISPAKPRATDTITCGIAGFEDVDGDKYASTFAWTVDGEEVGTGATLPVTVKRGQEVVCTATPTDGFDAGEAVVASATIVNSVPVVSAVAISPASLLTATVAGYTYTATDADGDALRVSSVSWRVDGAEVATTATLDGATFFDRGDVVTVTIAVTDETDTSTPVTSAGIVVGNTAPAAPKLSFDPEVWDWSASAEGLGCLVDAASVDDPDGDKVSLAWTWEVAGAEVAKGTGDPERLGADRLIGGEKAVCTVVASDGTLTASASISLDIPVEELVEPDWASIWWPCKGTIDAGGSFTVYGRVYMKGETDDGDDKPSAILSGQLGYALEGTDPEADPKGWTWIPGEFNVQAGNDEEWVGTIALKEPGKYDYAWRFSANDGKSWRIGDLASRPGEKDWCLSSDVGGSDDGYDSATAGKLEVR